MKKKTISVPISIRKHPLNPIITVAIPVQMRVFVILEAPLPIVLPVLALIFKAFFILIKKEAYP
jgi:hypothetical protein